MGILLAPGVFLQASAGPPICERQNEVPYGFGIGGSFLAGLEVSLSSLLFTVDWRIFLWAARLRRFLVRCIQALGFSCSFYP